MNELFLATVIFVLCCLLLATGLFLRKNSKRGELRGSCGGPEMNPGCCKNKGLPCPNEEDDKAQDKSNKN